jgi:hypothetical protein
MSQLDLQSVKTMDVLPYIAKEQGANLWRPQEENPCFYDIWRLLNLVAYGKFRKFIYAKF